MYTSCPQCGTTFSITITQLGSGRGTVKCGNCHLFFNALLALHEAPSEGSQTDSTPPISASSIPELLQPDKLIRLEKQSDNGDPSKPAIEPVAPWEKERTATSPGQRLLWLAASLIALTLLAYQLYLHEGKRILSNKTIRPLLEQGCQQFGCELPPLKMVSSIDVVNRSIKAKGNKLELKITIANHAEKPQPFPLIKLTLSNLLGKAVAQRVLTADEYLPKTYSGKTMPVDTPVEVELMVIKPVSEIEGFSFELL